MGNVCYNLSDGSSVTLDVPVGRTIMEASVRNNLPGIIAECGGSCSCATCHVLLAATSTGAFPEPTEEEADLLEFLEGAKPNSRLACQLVITEETPDVAVTMPDHNG